MKAFLFALTVGLVSISLAPTDADARRLGGGSSAGMQRSIPARTPPAATPAQTAPAATAAIPGTPAAAAAAAPRRSWMGPIAGLAAGLGIAALMSHLGMGAQFGNILMIVLLGIVAIVAIRFLFRRFGPTQAASPALAAPGGMQYAGPGILSGTGPQASGTGSSGSSSTAFAPQAIVAAPVAGAAALPAGFDAPGFERIAKMIFIRMQAANDSGDLNDLRAFTTPEMYASTKVDLQDRAGRAQQTDVVKIDAEVLEVVSEADRQVVSVRFHGLIREEQDAGAAPFDEIWHLVRPVDGSREWAIAGIQQMA